VSVFDDDIDTMLEDFDPVWLVFGSSTGNAISDAWDEESLASRVTGKGVALDSLALLIKTSAFPGLKIGSVVVVQQKDGAGQPVTPGVSYNVLDRQRPIEYADGRITHILLQLAA
jgi:hypothetical protein